MSQNDAVNKLITDLKRRRPVSKDLESIIKEYLSLSFALGFDENRGLRGREKRVLQLKHGIVIDTWPSGLDAAKAYGVTKSSLYGGIRKKTKVAGFNWEYEK